MTIIMARKNNVDTAPLKLNISGIVMVDILAPIKVAQHSIRMLLSIYTIFHCDYNATGDQQLKYI